MTDTLIRLGLPLLVLLDPIGNAALFAGMLKKIAPAKRLKVLLRELVAALFILLFFFIFGGQILSLLGLSQNAITIGGAVILFLVSLHMVYFKSANNNVSDFSENSYLVPMAIPLQAGPSAIAYCILLRGDKAGILMSFTAIILTWLASALVLLCTPLWQKFLREQGMQAMEKLMGLLLLAISIQMFLNGIQNFVRSITT